MTNPLLDFDCIKTFPGFELNVNVSIEPGITAIFGPSGSGKTTMLNCIAGVEKPNMGNIKLNGRQLFLSLIHI